MSDYDLCPYVEDPADVFTTSMRTARRAWCCIECNATIKPGERHERCSMLYRGEGWSSFQTCQACLDGPVAFFVKNCGVGREIGGLQMHFEEVFREYVFQHPGVKFRVGRMLVEMRRRGAS